MRAKVGVREVAELAGVSVGTVSNVLNGVRTVSPQNIARVERAMNELGFVPNLHARQLRGAQHGSVAMLVLSISNPFFAQVAHDAQVAAEQHGSTFVIASSDQDPEREARYIRMFEESRVRGLIVAPVAGAPVDLAQAHERGLPVVVLDERLDDERFCSVTMDGAAGGYLAGEHLLDIGRRRLAVVGGPLGQIADRVSGISRAVEERQGALVSIIGTDDLTVEEGRRAGRRIADLRPQDRPDGVFAANDLVALGLMFELERAGIRIPHDIAVIGYDDIEYAATAVVPLTTIAQPRTEIAQESIRLILDEEEHGRSRHIHRHRQFAPNLVVRSSTQI